MTAFDTELLEDADVVGASPIHTHRRERRVIVCTLVLIALLLGVIAVGLVRTVRLQKKQTQLAATLASQEAENKSLQEKNDSLSSENSQLADELGSQKSQNASLAAQNEQLKKQVSLKEAEAQKSKEQAQKSKEQTQTATQPVKTMPLPALSSEISSKDKLVALTFDDGPGKFTAELLDYLAAHHVHATFFLVGRNAARYPALIKRMDAEGHAIGNHTQNHARLPRLSAAGVKKEIDDCNAVIRAAVGHDAVMLRAPGGNANATVKAVAKDMGLPIAYWSVDTRDWQSRDTDKIVSAAFAARGGIKDGSIVLMHDIYRTTVDAAKIIIPRLEAQGYRFVTVPELLALRRGGAVAGDIYGNGYPGR